MVISPADAYSSLLCLLFVLLFNILAQQIRGGGVEWGWVWMGFDSESFVPAIVSDVHSIIHILFILSL